MFKVPIDKIIPVMNARAKIATIVSDVQKTKSLYVLTRGGVPVAILASIDYLNNKFNSLKNIEKPEQVKMEKQESDLNNPGLNQPNKLDEQVKKETKKDPLENIDNDNNTSVNTSKGHDDEQPVEISLH